MQKFNFPRQVPTDAPIEALELLDMVFENSAANAARIEKEKAKVVEESVEKVQKVVKAVEEVKEAKEEKVSKAVEAAKEVKEEKAAPKPEDKKVNPKLNAEKPQKKAHVEPVAQKPKTSTEDRKAQKKLLNPETKNAHRVIPQLFPSHLTPRGQKKGKRTAVDNILMKKPQTFGL